MHRKRCVLFFLFALRLRYYNQRQNIKRDDDVAFSTVFKRYELKYLLTLSQRDRLKKLMAEHMIPDSYGKTVIRNIYFDTDDYRLIRQSIEKPVYKEKLRLRSYKKASEDTVVFAELKKKYDHIVYKRRVSIGEPDAVRWLSGEKPPESRSQITDEIDYFISYYKKLEPKAFISYEREAYFGKDDGSFRITFDTDIFCRTDRLSLEEEAGGERILPEENVLMEIKCSSGIPLWLASFLSEEKLYKTSFSKYGTAYCRLIFPSVYKEEK